MIDTRCPQCKNGIRTRSRWPEEAEIKDIYCNNKECNWKWKISRFGPESSSTTPPSPSQGPSVEQLERKKNILEVIRDFTQEIIKNLEIILKLQKEIKGLEENTIELLKDRVKNKTKRESDLISETIDTRPVETRPGSNYDVTFDEDGNPAEPV